MDDLHTESWHILYIDDDEDDYILACNMLGESRQRKIRLTQAAGFEEGAQKLAEDHYDAVLVDYDLSGDSGIELIRQFAPGYPAPLILYTGRGSSEVDLEAMSAGATLYLTKSEVNPLLFERAIRYAIQLRQRETDLQAAADRAAFLLQLSDALRSLSDPVAIQAEAVRVLGEHLDCDRSYYVEIDEARGEYLIARDWHKPGALSHARHFPIEDWPMPWLGDGNTWVLYDSDRDPLIPDDQRAAYHGNDIGAAVVVPLIKDGRLAAMLVANQGTQRDWTSSEVRLVEETAERTWAAVERARAEAALRQSEEKYRSLFNSIDEGFCIIEVLFDENDRPVDYRFLEVNEMFEQQTGIHNGVGRRVRELVPRHEEYWFEIYGQIAKTGQSKRFENAAKQLNRYYDVFAFRIGRPDDHQVAVLFNDIAEQKRWEQDLQHYAQELERSNQALEEFTWIASHDLQEPLRKIKSFGRILETHLSADLGEEGQDYLKRMMSASERMQSLLQGLLEYARVSSEGEQFVHVDLNQVIEDVRSDVEVRILETGGKITVGMLPAVQGDPLQLRQLFQNLLVNALKYYQPGLPPQVTVTSRDNGNNLEIAVQDNGIGFDPEQAVRLFTPFTRLHSKSEYEGVGMGLAICRKIVERHGGTIQAESTPGQGSIFRVHLPHRMVG
jgi:signal transduction histidine kinase/DNA-binding NarL/FixJ family response regulator